ncbi:molybdopterin biosynthesis protein MoeA [Nonlabens ulvanivorans]|uniref:Molybdopterin molybdenumtransferase n=1 Tax=Nonlabens ulvanivorans TaxID=906888 RepID=A0A090X2M8_NONUL|nr:gephyrin-like molybdotransferase Glp [Nonlabens ulvanivorans]GAL74567.1 molybdopterin biosynthesis protein MoeA [Nonlabens ulvanivorans]
MISVENAIKLIEKEITTLKEITVSISKALGCVLAEDIYSPIDMPPFRQSSMDGYAFIHSEKNRDFKIINEVQAGMAGNITLGSDEAVRIFTGARVPDRADTVVMQEHTKRNGETLTITKNPNRTQNIRPVGEQLKKNSIALKKGTVLNEAALGFLAGLGIERVKVYQKPKVSLLLTGNELQQPGKPLSEGQVYDSTSTTLTLALQRFGITNVTIAFIEDTKKATEKTIKEQLLKCDVLLISGGISVGDYDFVKGALKVNGVQEHFYKVNQKPGKPLWFGSTHTTKVFALPGNPASSLTCFYVYVAPAIRKIMGYNKAHLKRGDKLLQHQLLKTHLGKHCF